MLNEQNNNKKRTYIEKKTKIFMRRGQILYHNMIKNKFIWDRPVREQSSKETKLKTF